MKTESEKIEISKQVAEIVGRNPLREWIYRLPNGLQTFKYIYLVDDHGACAEIAAPKGFCIYQNLDEGYVEIYTVDEDDVATTICRADYSGFNSIIEATSWAICEAVIAQEKSNEKEI